VLALRHRRLNAPPDEPGDRTRLSASSIAENGDVAAEEPVRIDTNRQLVSQGSLADSDARSSGRPFEHGCKLGLSWKQHRSTDGRRRKHTAVDCQLPITCSVVTDSVENTEWRDVDLSRRERQIDYTIVSQTGSLRKVRRNDR
jgi:hypothetical protein